MSRQPRPALRAAIKKHQADPLQDPVGAFLVRQRPEVAPGGVVPPHPTDATERITDDDSIAKLLASVSTLAEGNDDDLLFELLYLETLIAAKPLKSNELLEQLGALGEEVREGLLPPGTINLVALRNRTRRLKQHLGGVAGRISAAMLMLFTSLPLLGQQAQAAESKDDSFQIAAAAPVVRVIDANTGVGLAGVTIKSMEEKVLGVTDANGQATLSEEYHNTDLMSLEKSGYELSLLERSQLAARNIISMKPQTENKVAAAPKPNTNAKPMVKPPTAPGAGAPPHVAAAPGQAPHVEAPKPPSAPKAPQIRLPVRPKPTSAPVAAKPNAKAAAKPAPKPAPVMATLPSRPRPAQVASSNTNEAPVLPKPHVEMPTAPKAPAAKPNAAANKPPIKPHLPVVHHNDPMAGAARETAMSLPSRPRKPIQTATKPEAAPEREPISVSVPKRTPKPHRHHAATASAPMGGGTYRVKPGDSLSKLAQRYLGNASRWPELYAMNRGNVSNPRMIRVGQVLTMPGASMAGKSRVYVVRPGDSLFTIAGRQMGNGSKWATIYEANKDHIRDARMIFPGQKLVLPV
jgi:nucleoid-associated protein YgaU